MKRYLVLKTVGKSDRKLQTVIVLNLEKNSSEKKKRSVCVSGNLPELYHGMCIDLELDGTKAIDYELVLSPENIASLRKNNVDVEEYKKVLEKHSNLKRNGYSWKVAKSEISKVYECLPFSDADKVHKEIVNNAQDPCRINAINRKVVETARRKRKITYKIEEYLSYFSEVEQEGAYQQLMLSLKMMCLKASGYGFKNNTVYDNEMKAKEKFISENIAERVNQERSLLSKKEIAEYIETIKESGLVKEQLNVLWCLINSCPCVVTGGAGVGKTTVIKNIIECYAMHYKRNNILLIAPTGKAGRRLEEKTGMNASTVHKALRKNPEDNFVYYCAKNPLPHRLIIVDESSMIDTELMYDLLNAADNTSKIIFVGDHNQLYPVGYGEPFFDFMKTLKVYRLTVNHRQEDGTDILKTADSILKNEEISSGNGVAVKHITYQEIGDIITDDSDAQILSPYNELNSQINSFLRKGEESLNLGDKVMMIKNTKDYCNGDIGFIVRIDSKKGISVEIDGRTVTVSNAKRQHITLAYAITIHKMQGSESDRVIVFIPENDNMVDKRMMYTAVTRARKKLEIYYYSE